MLSSKIIVLFTIIFITFSSGFVYAQTSNPDELPNALNPKCGFSDIPNANVCCEPVDYEKIAIKPVTDMISFVPFIGSTLSLATSLILSKGLALDPIRPVFEQKCITGVAADERNQKTGLKSCVCISAQQAQTKPIDKLEKICSHYLSNTKERNACVACAQKGSILTGVGCIPTNFSAFITDFLLKVGIGFAGLFSLGCIIYSAIMIQVSQGNAEKISQAQDQIKACIFGLLIVMFSILILRIIGVNVIGIPGFD